MYIIVHQQDLKNRVTGAKNWRADGEAKQKAGKIPEAIASYRQSLKLLPDAALEAHVRMLEGKQAEAGEKKATADKLWQEGTALFNQGRPSDALAKFKESLGYWSDATRTKYVADMEARRAKAVALREEGAKLQQGNRIPEAIAKYKESLTYWPDSGLTAHIATLEKSLSGIRPPSVVSGGIDGTWEVSFNNFRGKMELQRSAGGWSGRLWLDAHQKWEQLTNISHDPGTGRVEFTRPISGATQRYSGVLSADKLEGTFTQQNSSGKYSWWAKRTAAGAVVSTGSGSTVSPPVTPPSTASYDGTYSGTVSGGSVGTVQFTVSGTSVTGTVSGKYGQDAYRATLSGTLNRSTGEISTKLAGDVTGTPFQGGLKGRIQGSSASGDWHARNQYGNPTGTWQASRGGIQESGADGRRNRGGDSGHQYRRALEDGDHGRREGR